MAARSFRWLALLPPLWLPALGVLPTAAFSERGPVRPLAATVAEDTDNARVIVKYRSGASLLQASPKRPLHAARLSERLSLALTDGRMLGERTQSLRGQGLSSQQLAARLSAQADVEWAVVDRRRTINAVLPNDPYFAGNQTSITPAVGQWYLRTPDGSMPAAVDALGAWGFSTGSGSVTVAVIDTGVRLSHPDLAGKLWSGYDFVADTATANDGGGRDADPSDPGDWTVSADGCSAGDSSWHGTQVAGLIGAATDNGIGMAGVGRDVMLLPVRVMGKCGGHDSDIIAGMRWAAGITSEVGSGASVQVVNAHPAKVLNLSLGATGSCSASYRDAIAEIVATGVTVVVAAGNDTGHAVSEPANCAGAIAVAGMRHIGTKVGYSNIGPEVALSAPAGNCVNTGDTDPCLYPLLTTINSGTTVPAADTYSDSYNASLGTSFAAPIVAGTVALMLSADPTLTPAQIKSKLQATARSFPSYSIGATTTVPACHAPTGADQLECLCSTSTCGAGLLDAAAAVASAAGGVAPPVALIVASTGTPTAGSPVGLQGTVSSRSVTAYQWTITAGADKAGFSGNTSGSGATLLPSAAGSVTVSLQVSDAQGATAATTQTFSVAPSNVPTAVIAASSVAPTVGTDVTLDGSGSSAVTGRSITGYNWSITSGAGLASLSSATNASTATLRTTGAGTVVVNLTVTDNAGATRSTTQTITVQAAPVAVISASSTSPTAGSAVTLDGSGSTAASGRSITGWQWTVVSGGTLAALNGATNASSATLQTSAAGTVVVSLKVTDSAGASATSAQVLSVAAAPVVVSSSGGGGGALGWPWLAGLALAVGLLWRRPAGQRPARRPADR